MTGYTQNTADTKQRQQQLERAWRGNFSYFAQLTFVVITFESVEMSFYLWKCVICNRPSMGPNYYSDLSIAPISIFKSD